MKKISSYLIILLTVPSLVSCGPAFLKKIINENPEIITESIKNNPEKYMEALSEAQRKYIQSRRVEEEKKSQVDREKEFESPKVPKIGESRVLFGKKGRTYYYCRVFRFSMWFLRKSQWHDKASFEKLSKSSKSFVQTSSFAFSSFGITSRKVL